MPAETSGVIFLLLIGWSAVIGGRAVGGVACREPQEYRSGSVCCRKCPAGTSVEAPCTVAGQLGTCRECDDGKFMEHTNSLRQCFRCTPCRSDQEVVRPCTHTLNTECRCAPGRFCDPEQACELCKKCSRCGQDEEAVRNCTPTANTECKKVPSTLAPPAVDTSMIVLLAVLAVVVTISVVAFCVWKHRRDTASQSSLGEQRPAQDLHGGRGGENAAPLRLPWSRIKVKTFKHTEEERKVLRDSCSSSASNSQYSLTGVPSCPSPAPPPAAIPVAPPRPPSRDEEKFPPLVAVSGVDSLRSCFKYFEELDLDYYRKFFRRLNINDNVIKGKEELQYEDRVHDLLHIWMEKEGKGASLDQLLQVLLDLNQRRTAENIREQALHHGHYLCEG